MFFLQFLKYSTINWKRKRRTNISPIFIIKKFNVEIICIGNIFKFWNLYILVGLFTAFLFWLNLLRVLDTMLQSGLAGLPVNIPHVNKKMFNDWNTLCIKMNYHCYELLKNIQIFKTCVPILSMGGKANCYEPHFHEESNFNISKLKQLY